MQAILPVTEVTGNDNANVGALKALPDGYSNSGLDRYPDVARRRRTMGRGDTPRL
jgi:hypothetical protein